MLLLVCTFTTLNTRQVCQLVFPTSIMLWELIFNSGNLKLKSINPFHPGNKAMNHGWTTLTLFKRTCNVSLITKYD